MSEFSYYNLYFYLQSLLNAVMRKIIFKSNKRTSCGIEEECSEDNLEKIASAIGVLETKSRDLT